MNSSTRLFNGPRCFPIEEMIIVFPAGILILFDLVFGTFGTLIQEMSDEIRINFMVYLAGICLKDKNQTALGISSTWGIVSHDSLSRVLSHGSWDALVVMNEILRYAIILSGGVPSCYLILDDVIIDKKYSKKIGGSYWDFDYVNNKSIKCIRLVVLLWTDSIIKIPVGVSVWHKSNSKYLKEKNQRYRTKNELARILVYKVIRKGLRFDYLTFDSWYSGIDNLRFFDRLGITFYGIVKSNYKITPPGFSSSLSCSSFSKSFYPRTSNYHYYKKIKAHAKKFISDYKGLAVSFVIVKNYYRNKHLKHLGKKLKGEKDPNRYLITNDLSSNVCKIIYRCKTRWAIEVFFRDLKGHLGINSVKDRIFDRVQAHLSLVMFGYLCLEIMKNSISNNTHDLSIGDVKRHFQNRFVIVLNGVERPIFTENSLTKIDKNLFQGLLESYNTKTTSNQPLLPPEAFSTPY